MRNTVKIALLDFSAMVLALLSLAMVNRAYQMCGVTWEASSALDWFAIVACCLVLPTLAITAVFGSLSLADKSDEKKI